MDLQDHADTAQDTLLAIASYIDETGKRSDGRTVVKPALRFADSTAHGLAINGYLGTLTTWVIMVQDDNRNRAIIERTVTDYDVNTLYDASPNIVIDGLSAMPLGEFANAICEAILGFPYIPLTSRKSAREIEHQGCADADAVFMHGMQQVISKGLGGSRWNSVTNPERWDIIEEASLSALGEDFFKRYAFTNVTFYSENVYHEAYYEAAYEHMSKLWKEA